MLKLLLALLCSMILAIALLELRQQRLELNYQTNKLHNQIRENQAKLWDQQLQIAVYTAPNAISKTVGAHSLKMVPESPLPDQQVKWLEQKENTEAE